MGFRTLPHVLVGGALLFACAASLASDGVIEINQAKAIAGSVTPGDAGGFPVTLSGGGSFRLTSDLDVTVVGLPGSADTDAIRIEGVESTTIDLNGFRLLGPADCDSSPCANAGVGAGIRSEVGSNRLISIRNGSVTRMGGKGLLLSNGDVRISDVSLLENGGGGISMVAGIVSRVIARRNGGPGIDAYNAVIDSSYASGNLGNQFQLFFGTIQNCTIDPNGGPAIQLVKGALQNSHVKTSGGIAFTCTSECALSGNKFSECTGAACYGGAGTRLHVPPASNMCGDVVCP